MPDVDEFVERLVEASAYSRILFRDLLVVTAVLVIFDSLIPLSVSFYVDIYLLLGLVLLVGLPTLLSFASSLLATNSRMPTPGRRLSRSEVVAARVATALAAGLLLWLSVDIGSVFALLYGSAVALAVYLLFFLYGGE
ncbi:MAG: hypothetical protein ACE5IJ_03115 [Thermoplasmata archaeon]